MELKSLLIFGLIVGTILAGVIIETVIYSIVMAIYNKKKREDEK